MTTTSPSSTMSHRPQRGNIAPIPLPRRKLMLSSTEEGRSLSSTSSSSTVLDRAPPVVRRSRCRHKSPRFTTDLSLIEEESGGGAASQEGSRRTSISTEENTCRRFKLLLLLSSSPAIAAPERTTTETSAHREDSSRSSRRGNENYLVLQQQHPEMQDQDPCESDKSLDSGMFTESEGTSSKMLMSEEEEEVAEVVEGSEKRRRRRRKTNIGGSYDGKWLKSFLLTKWLSFRNVTPNLKDRDMDTNCVDHSDMSDKTPLGAARTSGESDQGAKVKLRRDDGIDKARSGRGEFRSQKSAAVVKAEQGGIKKVDGEECSSVRRQSGRHTFGRVKAYVLNRDTFAKTSNGGGGFRQTAASRQRQQYRQSCSTPCTPRLPRGGAGESPRLSSLTPTPTPRRSRSANVSPVRTSSLSLSLSSRSHSAGVVDADDLSNSLMGHRTLSCEKGLASAWRVRVWLRLTRDMGDRGVTTMQLCHVCKPTCNYRGDLKLVVEEGRGRDELEQVLWYRFLGRQVELDLERCAVAAAEAESSVPGPRGGGGGRGGSGGSIVWPPLSSARASLSSSSSATAALREKQRQLSQRLCSRCGEGFSLLFNRRLECSRCTLGACRKCSRWRTDAQAWQCMSCQEEE